MEDETFDIVLSMNGFHTFPDKMKAFQETYRVLKPGGDFIACFYIKGKAKQTDWLVKIFYQRKDGLLLRSRLKKNLEILFRNSIKS